MVVAVGETLCDPEAATVPIPWLMLTVVALVVLQVNVADVPARYRRGEHAQRRGGRHGPERRDRAQQTVDLGAWSSACTTAGGRGNTAVSVW